MNVPAPSARIWHWCVSKGLRATAPTAVVLVFASTDWGHATTSVRGTIADTSGGAVGGATVAITNTESHIERTATTGSDGTYQFLLLPPGTYKLVVSAQGFQRYEQTSLDLLVTTSAPVTVHVKV